MLNPVNISADNVARPEARKVNHAVVNNVFKVFHGNYGNLFLSKYTTGKLAEPGERDARGRSIAGQDKGVLSAREVWAHTLSSFSTETVLTALDRAIDLHPQFPPSMGEFKALCKACAPRDVYQPAVPEISMSQELRSQRAARSREIVAKHREKARVDAVVAEPVPGLDLLKQSIADAVSCAGGNEAAELCRLDRLFVPRVAA